MTITKVYCDHCQNEIRRDDIEKYIGTAKHTKPPLGLVPRFIRDEARVKEIIEAIGRYNEAGKPVPQEWLDELNEKTRKEQ